MYCIICAFGILHNYWITHLRQKQSSNILWNVLVQDCIIQCFHCLAQLIPQSPLVHYKIQDYATQPLSVCGWKGVHGGRCSGHGSMFCISEYTKDISRLL